MSCKIQTALVVLILCGLAVAPPPPSSQRYCSKISPFGGSCNAGFGNGNGNCDYCPERQKCCLVKTEGDGVNAGLDHCPIGCCIDPPNCWDMNECEGDDGMTVCGGANQICVNTIGSYKCTCTAGFTFDESDSSCKNINECLLMGSSAVCTGDHEECVDTDGSYCCDCMDNYRRDLSTDPCLAEWVTGKWGASMGDGALWVEGECDVTCGSGKQTRQVTCPTHPNTQCYGTEPEQTQDCCTGESCPAWIKSSWSDCPSCGIGVTQERTVSCVGGAALVVLSDDKCSGTKPGESQACPSLSPCVWMPSDDSGWSDCTACCGETGKQQRTVYCSDGNGGENEDSQCTAGNKPVSEKTCEASPECTWIATEWGACGVTCGTGSRTRGVSCFDFSCGKETDEAHCKSTKLDYTEACEPDPPLACAAGDRCASGPCQHCGTCNTDVSHVDGICTCDNGFVGDFCETSGCNDVDLHACVPDGHGCILNKAGNSNCKPLICK